MNRDFTLAIPRPCQEKWEDFTQAGNGGFCASCSKTVVDFTIMSDDAILKFFANPPTHACGRFRSHQLKTYTHLPLPKVSPGLMLLKAGFVSVLLLIMSKQATAQTVSPPAKTNIVDQPRHKGNRTKPVETHHTLRGTVSAADDGAKLPGVNVMLKGSTVGTVTDAHGWFEFPQKVKEGDVIVFYFIGLETKEYTVSKNVAEDIQLNMSCDYIIMGEVAIDAVYEPAPTGFRKLWAGVKNVF